MCDLRGHATKGGGAIGPRKFLREHTRFVACDFKLGVELIQRVYDAIEFALAGQPEGR